MNGDLYAIEANGVPTSVSAYDTPVYNKPRLNADLGLYLTDTWKIKRLTITPGIRWNYLSNQIDRESAPAGRFVPARSFSAITCSTSKGISCFKDWAPRLGLVYDLFGNHKTALKAGAGMGPYTASKASVHRLTESLAQELKADGITVNAVLPATIDTPANRADMPKADFSTWVTPEAMVAQAFVVAVRRVNSSVDPEAVRQDVMPLNSMQTSTRCFASDAVE